MWAKVDDGWWKHRKVMALSWPSRGLWVTCLSYCGDQSTPHVPAALLAMLRADDGWAAELVDAGLWDKHQDGDGYVFHDWDDWTGSNRWSTPDPTRRVSLLWAERPLVERDGFACANCGALCPALHIDHIVPVSRGGSDDLRNLQWLCPPCNMSKAHWTDDEWEESGRAAFVRDTTACSVACDHEPSARHERVTGWDV